MGAYSVGQLLVGIGAILAAAWGGIKIYRDSHAATRASALDGFNRLVERLETRLANVEAELSRAQSRITILEGQSEVDQQQIQELLAYIAYLQRFIAENVPGKSPLSIAQRRTTEGGL